MSYVSKMSRVTKMPMVVAMGYWFCAALPRKLDFVSSTELKRAIQISADVVLSTISFLCAMIFRCGWSAFDNPEGLVLNTLTFSLICAVVYWKSRVHLRSWRFVSTPDIVRLTKDIVIAVAVFGILSVLMPLLYVPRSVPLIACFIMITTMSGMRVFYRSRIEDASSPGSETTSQTNPERILVYGATANTDAFLRSLQVGSGHSFEVAGIIDDDPGSRDRQIQGVKVLGTVADLARIISSFSKDSIALSNLVLPGCLSHRKLSEIIEGAADTGLRLVRLPQTDDLLKSQWSNGAFNFKPIKVSDLLGREPCNLRLESIDGLIRGKSIAVTGGGGSIGSELCRSLLRRAPAKLVIIDHSEFNLFRITRELAVHNQHGVAEPILASVRDRHKMNTIFKQARVDLVFHAAAYKHVPLVEANPIEGIITNVIGTANVADAAAAAGATAMVMVSTDKAVKPSNVMGLSKRIAERYCQALDLVFSERNQHTRFLIVRFGNVLGSSGSVVPIFEQQIRNGGPVTVTDPAMTRYFMTIPEAVELILQATTCGCERENHREARFWFSIWASPYGSLNWRGE